MWTYSDTPKYRFNKLSVRQIWLWQRCIEYAHGHNDTSDASKHCKADLDSIRTPVERQIMSVSVIDKLIMRLVTAKRVGYRPEVTSQARN